MVHIKKKKKLEKKGKKKSGCKEIGWNKKDS